MTYFETPADPEGFSVDLTSSGLKNIDFTALDANNLLRSVVEYVKTYHKDTFNDFVNSNGFIMLCEALAYIGAVMSNRSDVLVQEAFLPTAFTWDAVENHLNLIGQKARRQTPAASQVVCYMSQPTATDLRIPTNGITTFSTRSADGSNAIYELYSAPGDWYTDVIIPAGKSGVIGWAIEGQWRDSSTYYSDGGSNQQVLITDSKILDEPIIVTVDNIPWSRVDHLEDYGADDIVFEVRFIEGGMLIVFGDNIHGQYPRSGQAIVVRYRVGGGVGGRIGSGAISDARNYNPDEPVSAPVVVNFSNFSPSIGGYNAEALVDVKKRAPSTWSTHKFISTGKDYAVISNNFKHPVYGSVLKAASAIYTNLNANVVRVSVLVEGPDGVPGKPSSGLKQGLNKYLSDYNVATDSVDVVDGKLKSVNLEADVVVYKNSDATLVKETVDAAISSFFDVSKWEIGQPLYVSDLYNMFTNINGVKHVDIFKPVDDILPIKDVGVIKLTEGRYCNSMKALNEFVANNPIYSGVIIEEIEDSNEFYLRCAPGVSDCDIILNNLIYNFPGSSGIYIIYDCSKYHFGSYDNAIDFDELIYLSSKVIRYYYEK